MEPIYTAFYTRGTLYEHEAKRLSRSLSALGLLHDVYPVEDRGSWLANTRQTPEHMLRMLETYPRWPVVCLDADAVVWSFPELFAELDGNYDIAVHYRPSGELLNGTVWWGQTETARAVARRYLELVQQALPGDMNEQKKLAAAIQEIGPRVFKLPASYCFIFDLMKNEIGPGVEPVIEHLQASRETNGVGTPYLDARRKRIAEIEAAA